VTLLLCHGPNLNLLGERNPAVYGTTTLMDIEAQVAGIANERGHAVLCFQSNHEGALIDFLHEHRKIGDGVILNGGAWTHYSLALHDALEAIELPVVEVHISNTHAREEFRHRSYTVRAAIGHVAGLGVAGYTAATHLLIDHLEAKR